MFKLLIAAAALAVTSVTAQAQSFEGAVARFEFQRYDDGAGFTVDSVNGGGDISFLFASGFGVQAGVNGMHEIGSSDPFLSFQTIGGAALHLFHDVSDTTRLGVIGAFDTFNGGDWFLGVEGVFIDGPWRVEGRVGHYFSAIEPAWLASVTGSYALNDQFRLRARLRNFDYGPGFGYYRIASIGAVFDVTEQISVYGDYGLMWNDFGVPPLYRGTHLSAGITIRLNGSGNTDRMFTYNPYY